jgi:predicted nucleic acid-binding Zn ribbon protein
MPLYEFFCDCGERQERIIGSYDPNPICSCGQEMHKLPGTNVMVKMKGEGGYPSRRKQVFNTTYRKHPQLEKEKNRTY